MKMKSIRWYRKEAGWYLLGMDGGIEIQLYGEPSVWGIFWSEISDWDPIDETRTLAEAKRIAESMWLDGEEV